MIPYGRQSISEEDIQAVVEVLKSDFLTQGPVIPRFEQSVCNYTTAKYGVAVNSGTAALHIACEALGLGDGDWLWTTPVSFVASSNCGLYCGAKIDFVDIDPVTSNISVGRLRDKLEQAQLNDCLPKVVVAVHLCGLPCDMSEISKLSRQYGFKVIEDASHAIGGKYLGNPVGNCKYSDITVFSFHPVKTMTTGEGGMAMTNQKSLSDQMSLLRSHGITRNPDAMTKESDGPWYYQQIALGFNYRQTDIQAALGLSQLEKLDMFVSRRHEIADRYDELLSNLPLQLPHKNANSYSGLHLYVIRLSKHAHKHRQIFEKLRANGVGVNLHYIPIHTQPYYQKMGFKETDFPESLRYYKEAISLPMYPDLPNISQEKVVDTLKICLK